MGVVSGGAATPSQTNGLAQTGFVWYGGPLIPLGTLGPPQFPVCPACSSEGASPNLRGEVAVISETSAYNGATGEDFCGFGTHHQCLAALWQNGRLTALPTLAGGRNAQTYWINNQGQAVGLSENGIQDSSCAMATPYQQFHFEAVIWEPNGAIRQLTLPKGDTVAFGFGINDNGEAIGISGFVLKHLCAAGEPVQQRAARRALGHTRIAYGPRQFGGLSHLCRSFRNQ